MSQFTSLDKSNFERGASFVEAAIIFPVLTVLVFGVIQMGYIMSAYITLRNASAAGARAGIINATVAGTPSAFGTLVATAVKGSIAPLDPAIVVIQAPVVAYPTPLGSAPIISVTVNYALPLFPGSKLVLGQTGNFAMTSSTTMR